MIPAQSRLTFSIVVGLHNPQKDKATKYCKPKALGFRGYRAFKGIYKGSFKGSL